MENRSIYQDIAKRTDGNIYIGVVGPVRTGKSTFIKKFMENLVIPNIENDYARERAIDELPQSAGGKTIMTTEPKFVPEEAVHINLDENASMSVRLIDCVGYIVPSSLGYIENNNPRMVITPWFDKEIPFNMAAEIGTQKVIRDHSSIGLVVTTDGTISDIPRAEYEEAEERVISELQEINKPFAILLNSAYPSAGATLDLQRYMEEKYGVPVIVANCIELSNDDIHEILAGVLYQFPVKEVCVDIPSWIVSMDNNHWLKKNIYSTIQDVARPIEHISHVVPAFALLDDNENIKGHRIDDIDLGSGSVKLSITIPTDLFYKILGEATGIEIASEADLMPQMIDLARCKREYDKIKGALDEVAATGYGIVMPGLDELKLEEPEIVNQGGKYGVKLRASAPSIHNVQYKMMCYHSNERLIQIQKNAMPLLTNMGYILCSECLNVAILVVF